MRTCYIAMPFIYDSTGSLHRDLRALALGDERRLKQKSAEKSVIQLMGEEMEYIGPYYYEEVANGVFSDSDCTGVVKKELELIRSCEVFIAVLDGSLCPGTVTELVYAAVEQKEIVLFYKEESADYDIDSLYWYPIVATQLLGGRVRCVPFTTLGGVLPYFGVRARDYADVGYESDVYKQIAHVRGT